MSVALAWLLQRSPNILLIPGTSYVAHLRLAAEVTSREGGGTLAGEGGDVVRVLGDVGWPVRGRLEDQQGYRAVQAGADGPGQRCHVAVEHADVNT